MAYTRRVCMRVRRFAMEMQRFIHFDRIAFMRMSAVSDAISAARAIS